MIKVGRVEAGVVLDAQAVPAKRIPVDQNDVGFEGVMPGNFNQLTS